MLWQSNYRLLGCWANSCPLSVNVPVTQVPALGHCDYVQPTPWCALGCTVPHPLATRHSRLELEVLEVNQIRPGQWSDWGHTQLGMETGTWGEVVIQVLFPFLLFLFFFFFFPSDHLLSTYSKNFEEEKYHLAKSRSMAGRWGQLDGLHPRSFSRIYFPNPQTWRFQKLACTCVPELGGWKGTDLLTRCSQEIVV
jgi:hypothetical protein